MAFGKIVFVRGFAWRIAAASLILIESLTRGEMAVSRRFCREPMGSDHLPGKYAALSGWFDKTLAMSIVCDIFASLPPKLSA